MVEWLIGAEMRAIYRGSTKCIKTGEKYAFKPPNA
jgi:hypothetical protein